MLRRYIFVHSQQAENAYGPFCEEILTSEGLMGFEVMDIGTAPLHRLGRGDVAILTRCFLTTAQLDDLLSGIRRGAGVVVLQPQDLLTRRVGLRREPGIVYPGYVRFPDHPACGDLALQTHLPIPAISMPGDDAWEVLANSVSSNRIDTGHPAAVRSRLGCGTLTLFFYDVAEAVARIRFGNPDLASYRALEWEWPHIGDMYAGHIDLELAHLPQADLHAQFLANVIVDLSSAPPARLWYYERAAHRTACVFQSDGDLSEPAEFDRLADAVERRGGHITFYLMRRTNLSEDQVQRLRDRGHTFAPHVDPLAQDEELHVAIPRALAEETRAFRARFGACSPTLQCHCAPWIGYMELLPVHIEHGYRLLFAPLSIPVQLWCKYMCGSGRPMKWYDRTGVLYDCWHQPVPTFDDSTLVERLRDAPDAAYEEFEAMLRASLDHTHTSIPILSHPLSFCRYSAPLFERCLDLLEQEGIPIYNADAWCAFHDRRSRVRIEQETDEDGNVAIRLSGLLGQVSVMIPIEHPADRAPAVSIDGCEAVGLISERLGRTWLFVDVEGEDVGQDIRIEVGGVSGRER